MASSNDSQQHVLVGKVRGTRGTTGELQIEVMSDFPGRFAAGEILFVGGQEHRVQSSYHPRPNTMALKLEGIESPQHAKALTGEAITVPQDRVPPLPEGHYYHFQLVGLAVHTVSGQYLGHITNILSTGSNDVYVVTSAQQEVLVPALDDVVVEVDMRAARMKVDLPEGLM